jgi:selenide,water dikinase
VDDPYLFGQIAAANAISDVYAMGGHPLTCLNLIAFPSTKLAPEVLNRIVAGGLSKITEAGAVLAGGHSIDDDEPKYGLAVNGLVHPQRYWSNTGARPGDILVLTKPIGSGVLFNANLKGWVSSSALAQCLKIITTLNKAAAETLQRFDVHAATDITGFGLAGHAHEMACGDNIRLDIDLDRLPIMTEALDMYRRGMTTGVNLANRQLVDRHTHFESDLPPWHREIVYDPQTSGGLLAAVPGDQGPDLMAALAAAGVEGARIIGVVSDADGNDPGLVFRSSPVKVPPPAA